MNFSASSPLPRPFACTQAFTDFIQRVLGLDWTKSTGVSFVAKGSPMRAAFICDLAGDPQSARFLLPIRLGRRVTCKKDSSGAIHSKALVSPNKGQR